MRWRRLAHRLPLTGVAVAGAVVGHVLAYVLAVPEPTARVALLGASRSQPGEPVARLARHLAAATDRSFVVGFGDEPAYAPRRRTASS